MNIESLFCVTPPPEACTIYVSGDEKAESRKSVILHFPVRVKQIPVHFCEKTIFPLTLGKSFLVLSRDNQSILKSGFMVKSKILIILFLISGNAIIETSLSVSNSTEVTSSFGCPHLSLKEEW